MTINIKQLEPVAKLNKDIIKTTSQLGKGEIRSLVDRYYQMQDNRIRTNAQVRESQAIGEPHEAINYLATQDMFLEGQIKKVLISYADSTNIGKWLTHNIGIGGVIASGLLAHLDIYKANTAGNFWSFCGLNPKIVWGKGMKRPFSAEAKKLCWKLGESFVKFSNHPDCFYGKAYKERKAIEIEKNNNGEFSDQAKKILEEKNFSRDTISKKKYQIGKLPDGHIHARAKRWAVKLFLSHFHSVWMTEELNKIPPVPYAIEFGGHTHFISPPFTMEEALNKWQ